MNENSKILVTYVTNSGSTAEVAERIAESLSTRLAKVETVSMKDVRDLSGYDGVVIGGPMIMGWHRKARRFVKKHRKSLGKVPFHAFMTAMTVCGTTDDKTVSIDPKVMEEPTRPGKPTMKDRHTHPDYYTAPLTGKNGVPSPRSIALLAGKLDYTKLKFPQVLFVMLVIRAKPGDRRNWDFIQTWAESLDFAS